MKYNQKIKELFLDALSMSNLKNTIKNRLFDESDYFEVYLDFISNSIHYSRYEKTIKKQTAKNKKLKKNIFKIHTVKGKYLNEKVNNWRKHNIFDIMFKKLLDKYKNNHKSKIYHIDGKIITNKYCNDKMNLGRNVKYKSKRSINLQTITDNNGIPLGFSVLKGSDSEVSNMIKVIEDINIDDFNHTKNSNKHKRYFTADAGYDSEKNLKYLTNKGYTPLIWFNKRNTKDAEKIKKRKLDGHKKEKYKKRHIVENFFSWMDMKIPRLVGLYDKIIKNYINMAYIATIDLIYGKKCV